MAIAPRSRVRFGGGEVCQLRVELEGIAPPIWRRLLVSDRATLRELHDIIAQAFGAPDATACQFLVDGVAYADAEAAPPPGHAIESITLAMLHLTQGARSEHESGDHAVWRHVLTVEQMSPRLIGQRLPICVAGARAAPPEDCDSAEHYRAILGALADPHHPEAADLRTWLPEHFDPDYLNLASINAELARVPRHRPAA